ALYPNKRRQILFWLVFGSSLRCFAGPPLNNIAANEWRTRLCRHSVRLLCSGLDGIIGSLVRVISNLGLRQQSISGRFGGTASLQEFLLVAIGHNVPD